MAEAKAENIAFRRPGSAHFTQNQQKHGIEDLGLPYLTDLPDYMPLMSYPPDGGEADEDEPPVFGTDGVAGIPGTGGNASFAWLMCFLAAGAAAGAAHIRKRRSGGKTRAAGRKTV